MRVRPTGAREHWKLIVTIVIVVVAVALLWTGVGGVLLAGALLGSTVGRP